MSAFPDAVRFELSDKVILKAEKKGWQGNACHCPIAQAFSEAWSKAASRPRPLVGVRLLEDEQQSVEILVFTPEYPEIPMTDNHLLLEMTPVAVYRIHGMSRAIRWWDSGGGLAAQECVARLVG